MQSDFSIRPLNGREELDLFCSIPYAINHEIHSDLDCGRRRLEWLWVAVQDGRLLGRIGWWTRSAGEPPAVLDIFDISGLDDHAGDALVATAMRAVLPRDGTPPQYLRWLLAPDWREEPAEVREAERRGAALGRFGARPLAERLRFQWDVGAPVPPASTRLTFRPIANREELVDLMTEVVSGTLDAHTIRELTAMTPAEQAASQYENELARYTSSHAWWRIAELPDGRPVGFVIPARNAYHPIIAYIGVLPEFRGHGYVDDILAEGTRVLAGAAVSRIRGATDVGNAPMARAFLRAGYRVLARQLDMVWE
ncbi:MAG: N-acetyltransferase [Chloroflexi bacterium AL-W]|nr:N-acetyltransferase [Chloroflexi bacterium AL-N1]NOK70545.1 N-acetyltransferase [Chloroflexi bacterium AL-N10]NOK78096.1 N-acetyltransferase [Chloroflexi bacterium AL-N5]NOK85195.1 N-acetyltransferase [Chloroflexi bacterium AL-W]